MVTDCTLAQLEFQAFGGRKVVGDFKGRWLSSGAAQRCCAKPTGRWT